MAALQFDRGRPFPSQLLAFPRESQDVTAVERDAAKLGQPCAAVQAGPSKNSLPLRGRRNAAKGQFIPGAKFCWTTRVFFASFGSTPAAPRGGGPAGRRQLPTSGRFALEV